jgi:hypothetical protein
MMMWVSHLILDKREKVIQRIIGWYCCGMDGIRRFAEMLFLDVCSVDVDDYQCN